MERKSMVGLIAIVAVVTAVMFAGCVEDTNEPQDSQWVSSCSMRVDMVVEDINEMQKDLASGNSRRFVESAKYLQEDAQNAYDVSVRYTVSPEYEALKSDYELAMLDYSQAGKHASVEDYDAASEYIESGNTRMERVNDMLDRFNAM